MPRKAYIPLPGTKDDPNLYESTDFIFWTRDDGLADLSDRALRQLTSLLWMDRSICVEKPDEEWLETQEETITRLHFSIRVPPNLFTRLAFRINRHHRFPFFPQFARLCSAHKGLDPRVIRNLTLLVGHECTLRTDRFRAYRGHIAFPNSVATWLDRIDSMTAMWVGKHAFHKVFGYKPAMPPIKTVESGCEACIMAVVGARSQLLCDLRASILARKTRYLEDKYRGGKEPRLLRIVDAWIAQFEEGARRHMIEESEMLAQEVGDVYNEMARRKERRETERMERGEAPRGRRRHRHGHGHHRRPSLVTCDDLPIPLQPVQGRYSRRASLPDYSDATICDTNAEVPVMLQEDNRNGVETWDWLDTKVQGLTPEERQELFTDIHPAFSNFRNASAVPEPLNSGTRRRYEGGEEMIRERDEDARSWKSVTVHTIDSETVMDDTPPSIPRISELYQERVRSHVGSSRRKYALAESDDEDDEGEYVPARRNWNPVEIPKNPFMMPPDPPASSFYSDHPGFPTNHKVTEVFHDPRVPKGKGKARSLASEPVSPRSKSRHSQEMGFRERRCVY